MVHTGSILLQVVAGDATVGMKHPYHDILNGASTKPILVVVDASGIGGLYITLNLCEKERFQVLAVLILLMMGVPLVL